MGASETAPEATPSRTAQGPEGSLQEGTCPECGSQDVAYDAHRGETVCERCGLVLTEGEIDHGPEWRAFNPEQREERSRTGPGRTIMRHDMGLGTQIGSAKDVKGEDRSKVYRMRRYHRRATYRPGQDRETIRALSEIERLAGNLGLPDEAAETAAQIYRRARKENFLHGRSVEGTAAASIYAASRMQQVPRPLDDIEEEAQREGKDVARTYRKLCQALELPVPITTPRDLLPSFASRLELPPRIEQRAIDLIGATDQEALTGKNPASVAAAALYRAARELGDHRTQEAVAEAAGVTEVTVRARLKDLADPDDSQAPPPPEIDGDDRQDRPKTG